MDQESARKLNTSISEVTLGEMLPFHFGKQTRSRFMQTLQQINANLMLHPALKGVKITLATINRQTKRLDVPNRPQQQHSIGSEEKYDLTVC